MTRLIGRSRVAVSLGMAITLAAASVNGVTGHSPSPGFQRWTRSQINAGDSLYKWAPTVPGWLEAPMSVVLGGYWPSPSTNNSDSIRFAHDQDGGAAVRFTNTSVCDSVEPGWLGCTTTSDHPNWIIWVRQTPSGGTKMWCEDPGNDDEDDCWSVYRIGIHEAAHAGGFLNDLPSSQWMSEENSIIRFPPVGPDARHTIGRCDEARFQLWYDVERLEGPYADCFHELAGVNSNGKLKTELTASPDETAVCSGQSVTLSGRLHLQNESSYGELAKNNLAQRPLEIYRNGSLYTTTTTNLTPDTAKIGQSPCRIRRQLQQRLPSTYTSIRPTRRLPTTHPIRSR